MKHEEAYGEMGETCRELPPGRFLRHLATSFQAAFTLPDSSANNCRICLLKKSVHGSLFFHGFLPHMVSCSKFIFMAVGGECRLVIFVLSFHEG